jgi:glycerophosphoryl diester phosphodiesterase
MLPPLYAHRLGRAYGPDSSAVALRGALAAGVDGLESDVCLTADGALVLLHDPYLPLGTNLEGFAHQRTARELRRARLRDREGRLTAEAPLFVEDLLAATPRELVVQLEVKSHADPGLSTRTVNALAERLRGRTRGRRVEVLSFTATCMRASGSARLFRAARRVVRLCPGGARALGSSAWRRRGVRRALPALAGARGGAAPGRAERHDRNARRACAARAPLAAAP